MLKLDKSNSLFFLLGIFALLFLGYVALFYESDAFYSDAKAPAEASTSSEEAGGSQEVVLVGNTVGENVEVPEITEEQYRLVKELVIAAEPSLASMSNLDEVIREPYLAQNIASLMEQVEENDLTVTQVRASVRGAGTGDFSPTGEDCAAGAKVILMDPACYITEENTSINENLGNYVGSGCDNNPATPCQVRASSVIEPWEINGPDQNQGYSAGTDVRGKTESERILIQNKQMKDGVLAYHSESGSYYGDASDAEKYEQFKQVNMGVANLLRPQLAREVSEDSADAKRDFAVEICAGGEEVCDQNEKTLARFKGTNSDGDYLSPANSNKFAEARYFGKALQPPTGEVETELRNECVDNSSPQYRNISKTDQLCLGSRRVSDVYHGVKQLGNEILCRLRPNDSDCQLQVVTGIQVGSMFGDTEYFVEGISSNYMAEAMVSVYSSPVDDRNVTMLRTPCTIRIDYSKIVDVYCYIKNQNEYAEFSRQAAEMTPGDSFKYEAYGSALEEEF
ncbi:MAG: hypothetical protein QY318_02760 [Candidatus Dojkabacteria bacterium]|nr:MAG: hypothetical protein QY318_02760 [Candidatus Dojkabacteria bacterium]